MARDPRRTAAVLLGAALLALPGAPAGAGTGPTSAPSAAELPRLHAELDAVTAQASALADALQAEAARNAHLRVELQRLADQRNDAQARLEARVRAVYISTAANPLAGAVVGLAADGLRAHAEQELAKRASAAAVRAEQDLVAAVRKRSAAAAALQQQAETFRAALRERADAVLAAQDRARTLLAETEQAAAAQRLAAAPATVARLTAARQSLDAVSASVTRALTPAETRRGRLAREREAPVLAAVEAAGAGYPAGWGPTGQVLRGTASWYGPGFVGNPTASGTPYDPERLTCAHKTLPLGTVLRVSRGDRAVGCLVNDRGPYAGDRILDLSRAGSRALGFDGVAEVTVEVLAPAR